MSRILVAHLVLALACTAYAQKPVRADLVPLFDRIAPPPSSAKEAYGKADCDPLVQGKCSADKFFRTIDDSLSVITSRMNAQFDKNAPPPGVPKDMADRANDKEFQKKMRNMSKEEKMKIAIEMAKNMQTPAVVAEKPEVNEAFREAGQLNQTIGMEFQTGQPKVKETLEHQQTVEKSHADIDAWFAAESKKVPQLSTGEMSYPEPKAYRALELKTIDKHIAVVDGELKKISSDWRQGLADAKKKFTPFETKLARIHYGEDARNPSTQTILANAQRLILESLAKMTGRSKSAYVDAATWYAKKVTLEKKPLEQ